MTAFRIEQEPGPAARRERERRAERFGMMLSPPRPKRAAVVEADTAEKAIARFVKDRYTGNRQFRKAEYDGRGSVTVTLRNGYKAEHETTFRAYEHDGRWDRRRR